MSDLEYPSGPNDYASGYFGANFNAESDSAYENWIDPGDKFFRVRGGLNADGSPATQQEIDSAVNTWENTLNQCQRWRIRLHHEALSRWVHETNSKVFMYYHSGIPKSKKDQIKLCLDQNTFEYLGQKASDVKTKLEDRQPGLTAKFWRSTHPAILPGEIDVVVFGLEQDAE